MAKITFLGMGVMGAPMAGHLSKAGHAVTVYNRTYSKAQAWAESHKGEACETVAQAVAQAEIVFACLGNDHDLRAVCLGADGALANMPQGSLFVDHTTVSKTVTLELGQAAKELGLSFLDAPVSGGQAGAENGALVIMCGGSQADYAHAEPIMAAYAKKTKHMGPLGQGQTTKMVNQIAIAGLLQGLSEALHFAQKADLDGRAVVDVIQGGAAGSWQMVNRHETMLEGAFDFGFAIDWMRKDLGICLETAEQTGASLPMTAMIDQYYKDLQNMGHGRSDTSALIERLRKLDPS